MSTETRTVTLNITTQVPTGWSDADLVDVLRFRLDAGDGISNLSTDDLPDVSAVEIENVRTVVVSRATDENYREETSPATEERTGAGHERGEIREVHPAFGLVQVSRVTGGSGTLFDSEVQHTDYMRLRVHRAVRDRALHRDWLHQTGLALIEIDLSLVQWASMVASPNSGSGEPCTIRSTQAEHYVHRLAHQPRLQESMDEVAAAANRTYEKVVEAMETYAAHKTAGNLRSLQSAIKSVRPNLVFAAQSLTEHTEAVVTKARADVEAMVNRYADRIGLDAADMPRLALGGATAVDVDIVEAEVIEGDR